MTQPAIAIPDPEPARETARETYHALVARLSQKSVDKHFDAYADIDWDNPAHAIDPSDPRFELTPDHVLGGTAWYRAQPQPVRAQIGLDLVVSAMKLGLEFENALSRGLLGFALALPDGSPEFRYAYHELIEESQHTLMFRELINRTGIPTGRMPLLRRLAAARIPTLATAFPELFFLFVLGGEDPIDHVQRVALAGGKKLHPLLARITQIHITEEARHLAFAREYLRRHVPELGPVKRRLLAVAAPGILGLMARMMLQAPQRLIRHHQIPPDVVRQAYLDNPRHQANVTASLGKVRELCIELGLVTPLSRQLWQRLGIWSAAPAPAGGTVVKVAVTGGSGQLGTLVVRRLIADRKIKQVVSIDVRPPAACGAKLRAVTCDVRDPAIAQHFEGVDAVIHLAFMVTSYLPRAEFDAINVGGSQNVFAAALGAGVRQLVYSSSIAAYGVVPGHPVPIVETTPRVHQQDFPYSSCKYEVEAALDQLEAAHPDVKIARLRPSILIGAHMPHALGDMLRRRVLLDAGASMPMVWDEDVADAIVLALRRGAHGAYNLTTDEPLGGAELARVAGMRSVHVPRLALRGLGGLVRALRAAGADKLVARLPDPAWLDSVGVTMIVSSERARRELGWKPRCRTGADVIRHYVDVVPTRLDRRLALFFRMLDFGARRMPSPPEARNVSLRMHLALTGPGGGDVGVTIDQGRLSVGAVPRPPDAIVTMRADAFRQLLGGTLNVQGASLTGKITIEGEPSAGMVIGGIAATLRAQGQKRGARGLVVRGVTRLLAGKAPREATPSPGATP